MTDNVQTNVPPVAPTLEELTLWRRVADFWKERPGHWRGYELWFDQRWSYSMIQMEDRNRKERIKPIQPQTEQHQAHPDNRPFLRVLAAMKAQLAEAEPWAQPRSDQIGHAMQLLFTTRLATDPDLVWCGAKLDDGMENGRMSEFLPRSLVARQHLEQHRADWSARVSNALAECLEAIAPDVICLCTVQTASGLVERRMWASTLAVLDLIRGAGGVVLESDVDLSSRPLLNTLADDDLAYIDAQRIVTAEGAILHLAPVKWSLRLAGKSVTRKVHSADTAARADPNRSIRSIPAFERAGQSYDWAAERLDGELVPGQRNYRRIYAEVLDGATNGLCPPYPNKGEVPARDTWEKYVRERDRIASTRETEGPSVGEGRSVVKVKDLE